MHSFETLSNSRRFGFIIMHLFKAYARNTTTEIDRFTRSLTNGCRLDVAGSKNDFA